jgi:transposase-like protein
MCDLTADRFQNEDEARKFLEASRWPDGPICPHCGTIKNAYPNASKPGVYRCGEPDCRKDFSVTVGTLFERSHIPLHKWLLATHLWMSSKKGISARQLWRMLNFGSYRTAWFMAHRIRAALVSVTDAHRSLGGQKIV